MIFKIINDLGKEIRNVENRSEYYCFYWSDCDQLEQQIFISRLRRFFDHFKISMSVIGTGRKMNFQRKLLPRSIITFHPRDSTLPTTYRYFLKLYLVSVIFKIINYHIDKIRNIYYFSAFIGRLESKYLFRG